MHRLGTKANEGLGLAKTRAHKGFVRLCAKTNEYLDKPGAYRPRELANIASGWAKLEASSNFCSRRSRRQPGVRAQPSTHRQPRAWRGRAQISTTRTVR
jgi:hypothetical protein